MKTKTESTVKKLGLLSLCAVLLAVTSPAQVFNILVTIRMA